MSSLASNSSALPTAGGGLPSKTTKAMPILAMTPMTHDASKSLSPSRRPPNPCLVPVKALPAPVFPVLHEMPRMVPVKRPGGLDLASSVSPTKVAKGVPVVVGVPASVVETQGTGRLSALTKLPAQVPVLHPSSGECLCDYSVVSPNLGIKNRLKRHLPFWRNITDNAFVLDMVKNGFSIPFLENPTEFYKKNNQSALNESDFVVSSILELLKCRFALKLSVRPLVVNPLSVSIQASRKKRLHL